MITSKDLEKKLAGKKILWRPTFFDVSGTKQYEDLLVGDRKKGFVPDIWVRTEDRLPESVIPADGTEITALSEDDKIRRVRIEHVREYSRLDGFTGVLHMPTDQARGHIEPDLGRVVECRVTCDTRDRGKITRTVIFVVAESLEFAMQFLIPHDIRVAALYQEAYHVGFNASYVDGSFMRRIARILGVRWYYSDWQADGSFMRRIARILGVRWYYSDWQGVQNVGDGSHGEVVFRAFPCLRDFSDVELCPFPDLDASPDSEVSDMHDVKCYIVGATFKEASALARIMQ